VYANTINYLIRNVALSILGIIMTVARPKSIRQLHLLHLDISDMR
jgi:hypothetical protein